MKKILIVLITAMMLSLSQISVANNAQMKETIVKILNQLQAIKPLINQAKQEQDANPRVKFHFDQFKTADGTTHSGLRDDVQVLINSIKRYLNHKNMDPRVFKPIKGDFVGGDHV